ncbi:MAG: phosphoglycerate kinase [Candidatus Omnitrophica bacterium]|nr:phosphoglycerate kinase [Candidatus Omnitrophota bacterium]HOX54561.1 phosphoglycerate kinase [Candidatus Omnitrophota bacterium]
MNKTTIKDCNFNNKKVLIRVDFNVPLDKNLNITDDTRITAAIPTIKYILDKNPKKVILMSHLGRPDGKVKEELRLTPVAKRLEKLLGQKVLKLDDCIGSDVESKINSSGEKIIMLENLRFHAEEEKNDDNFAKSLAKLADVYVSDAFGTVHRAHASTAGITKYLPSAAGLLLEKEINYLGKTLESPARPFAVILGGAKVSDKIGVIENLLPKAQAILIGGGMAYTFLKANGINIGKSKLEADKMDLAKQLIDKAEKLNVKILLPVDHVITDSIDPVGQVKKVKDIPEGFIAVDIGDETIKIFENALKDAKTICWNGPLGISEIDAFANGTRSIGEFISKLKATTIIGGGDTAAAMSKFGLENKMTHISTGGGASLEYMEGKVLPGIAALTDKK